MGPVVVGMSLGIFFVGILLTSWPMILVSLLVFVVGVCMA